METVVLIILTIFIVLGWAIPIGLALFGRATNKKEE